MGWEVRGGGRYYTRSRKAQGRVVRTYVGGGAAGELAAAADALRRANRRAAARVRREERERLEEASQPLRQLDNLASLLAQAALNNRGLFRHGGEWRRRAMTTTTDKTATATAGPATADSLTGEQVNQVLRRAMDGDRAVLPELAKALDAHPAIWQTTGDLAAHAREAWVALIAGKDLLLRESLQRKLEQMKGELAGTDPSRLEMLLIERVVISWLQVGYADVAFAQTKPSSAAQHQALQRRQTSAQQRHLQAVKMLLTVRKLLAPSPGAGEAQPRLFTPGAVG